MAGQPAVAGAGITALSGIAPWAAQAGRTQAVPCSRPCPAPSLHAHVYCSCLTTFSRPVLGSTCLHGSQATQASVSTKERPMNDRQGIEGGCTWPSMCRLAAGPGARQCTPSNWALVLCSRAAPPPQARPHVVSTWKPRHTRSGLPCSMQARMAALAPVNDWLWTCMERGCARRWLAACGSTWWQVALQASEHSSIPEGRPAQTGQLAGRRGNRSGRETADQPSPAMCCSRCRHRQPRLPRGPIVPPARRCCRGRPCRCTTASRRGRHHLRNHQTSRWQKRGPPSCGAGGRRARERCV